MRRGEYQQNTLILFGQKAEMKDVLSEEESGEHERMLIYGKRKMLDSIIHGL